MIRLFDRSFSSKQNVSSVLCSLYGLNKSLSFRVCALSGINPGQVLGLLPKFKINLLQRIVNNFFSVERPLRREYLSNIDQKIKKGSYQGIRLKQGLPVRGQRTHTNAKTSKQRKIIKN
jgi:small subunit ribosomal protein S13